MSCFRRIQMSLFLMLLYLTASAGQYSSFAVRDGDEVTLPCENAKIKQQDCKNTTWLFREAASSPFVELVGFGQMSEAKSDRLSVTAHCSLVLKKVSVEDVGRYSCRQFEGQDAHVYLSVINRFVYINKDMVTLCCSVSTYAWCTQRVKWLLLGKDVDKEFTDVTTSQSYCSANVTFTNSQYSYGSFMCEATDIFNGNVHRFTFSSQNPGDGTTTMRTIEKSTKATSVSDATKPQGWWRLIYVSLGLAVLIVAAVAVNMWTKISGAK